MKKAILAASAALSFIAMTPAAHAADTIIDLSGDYDDGFSVDVPSGIFSQTINFVIPKKGALYGSLSSTTANIFLASGPLTVSLYQGATLIGNMNYSTLGNGLTGLTDFGNVLSGNYSLVFSAKTSAKGSVSGTITLVPTVPEPATWAMMLVGVAAVGTAMRRRSRNVHVAFS